MPHDPPPSRRAFLAALAAATAAAQRAHAVPGRAPGANASSPPPRAIPEELIRLAGTCVMSGFYGTALPADLRGLIRRGALGGIIIARHNFRTREALVALCAQITALAPAGAAPVIAADQEGGPVAHLTPPLSAFPSMTAIGNVDDIALTRQVGAALGTELHAAGVTMNLAPVLDVRTSSANTVVLGRVFGRDPARVARHGQALIEGLTSANVLACAKHFPGHGDTAGDSHAVLPRVPHGLARLDAVELVPFRACAPHTPAVMLAHVVYAGVDPALPASLSRRVIEGVLRDHLHFNGVAISDDLQMRAIRGSHPIEQACELSMRAGCDMLMVAHTSAFAARAVRHLASIAMDETAMRERLTAAAARVNAMRGRFTAAGAAGAAGTASASASAGAVAAGTGTGASMGAGSAAGGAGGGAAAVDPAAVAREAARRVAAARASTGRTRDPTMRR